MTDYVPIPCSVHSSYELWIMHRNELEVTWRGPGGNPCTERLRPYDLVTRAGEEFLLARTAEGASRCLRLDWIEAAGPSGQAR